VLEHGLDPGDRTLWKAVTRDRLERVTNRADAHLVSSMVEPGVHMPVLDIDFPAQLVPTSTPGHFHLYLDIDMDWETYVGLLNALCDAGVIQPGYYANSVRRGASYARLPEKPKHLEKEGHPLHGSNSVGEE
jgi:hypothetical protein